MKEIMAIVRINKMNETKRALSDAGFTGLTAAGKVHGRGKGLVDYQLIKGAEEGYQEAIAQLGKSPRLMSKRLFTLVVRDEKKDLAVETIIKANSSGNPGDGKIFVMPVLDSVRVRTDESGDKTLD
ncbi:MAG: P-II family nitrogen regulator [Spirochaetales bacterium]|uniref:P-II family nitrogen regulator n=1 Tax=Candidatus Thalassospirochaeta sargassi TaxID=3119039 RepID=A0AAJ1MLD2_9SPIO|nr:P-II family nitrogen regulator [Spirochaetales bacterium]